MRSALIIVVTGGVVGCSAAEGQQADLLRAVSQSWLPSRMTRSGVRGSGAARARRPAERSAAMMPTWSISAALACPRHTRWTSAGSGDERAPCRGRQQFRVTHPGGCRADRLVDQDDPDGDGPGECPAPHLVHAGQQSVAHHVGGRARPAGWAGGIRGPSRRGGGVGTPLKVSTARPSHSAWPNGHDDEGPPVISATGTEPPRPLPSGSWKRESSERFGDRHDPDPAGRHRDVETHRAGTSPGLT